MTASSPTSLLLNAAHTAGLSGWEFYRQHLGGIKDNFEPEKALQVRYLWRFHARPGQIEPEGDWTVWLVKAGRGFGKTRMGAEWVREQVEAGVKYISILGETAADVRDIMVEGESGILACSPPWNLPEYEPSKRRLTWPGGAIANLYSGDNPDQLRGPQAEVAWVDELAKMRYASEAWINLEMGLRLGSRPRVIVTSTPRPTPLIRELIGDPGTTVTGGSTWENRANLAGPFVQRVQRRYEGTRLGRQELHGEVLDEVEGALWSLGQLESLRVRTAPDDLVRITVALDPAVTDPNKTYLIDEPDEWGIIVCGRDDEDIDAASGFVLEDLSGIYSPAEALHRAIDAYKTWDADAMVGETNNGGDLIEALLRTIPGGGQIYYKSVRASRGKIKRAEPVAGMYEQARIHHVGAFPALEDEMVNYTGAPGDQSPNRMDALVWGFTNLLLDGIEGGSVPVLGL